MVFLWLLCVSEWVLYVLQFADHISLFGSFYTSWLITLLHSSKPKRLPIFPWYSHRNNDRIMRTLCLHNINIHLEYNNKLFVFVVRIRSRITKTTATFWVRPFCGKWLLFNVLISPFHSLHSFDLYRSAKLMLFFSMCFSVFVFI